MCANYGWRAFVVRMAGSCKEESNLYITGRSETPARSHRRTEQRDIATVQCRFCGARQLSAMLGTQTCHNMMGIYLNHVPVNARCTSARELERRDHFDAHTVNATLGQTGTDHRTSKASSASSSIAAQEVVSD